MQPILAKKVMAPSGRWAILARRDESSPWEQVESVEGSENANGLVSQLQDDDIDRIGYVAENGSEDWGTDTAPREAFNA